MSTQEPIISQDIPINTSLESETVSVLRYYLVFILIHVVVSIVLAVLADAIEYEKKSSLFVATASACTVAILFIQRHKRPPNKIEKKRLVWGSLISCLMLDAVVVSVVALSAFVSGNWSDLMADIPNLPIYFWVIGFLFIYAIYYLSFSIAYGWFARFMAKTMKTKENREVGTDDG